MHAHNIIGAWWIFSKFQLDRSFDIEPLSQIIGNFSSSQEALMQITTKLRNNLFLTKFGPTYIDSKPPPYSGMMSKSEVPLSLRSPIMPVSAPYDSRYTPYSDIGVGYNKQSSISTWPPQVCLGYGNFIGAWPCGLILNLISF